MWYKANASLARTTNLHISSSMSMFVTENDEIFVDGGSYGGNAVYRWMSNGTQLSSPTLLSSSSGCFGLFVDITNNLYCSQQNQDQVVTKLLSDPSKILNIVAGSGCSGSAAHQLDSPVGIFVTITMDLYVADSNNDRIQLFRSGEVNATSVVGNGATGTFTIFRPTGITLDADGYLFIVDQMNHRVIGSGPDGYRCVVGCLGSGGTRSNLLNQPFTMSFDSTGNIFVIDRGNNRIQKFSLLNNSCGE